MSSLSLNDAITILRPLLYLVVIMIIYAVFVFKFYKLISKKNIFELNLGQYDKSKHKKVDKTFEVIFYVLEYIIIFPIISLLWVLVISCILFFVSQDSFAVITLGAAAVIVTIRATSYFSEELSTEVAKILPFVLLAFYLTKMSAFGFLSYPQILMQLPQVYDMLPYYALFILAFEAVLRILYSLNILYPEPKA